MLPILFSVGPITIYSLGFFLAIGFFLVAFITWRRLRELGFDEEKVIDTILFASLLSFLFSRLVLAWEGRGFSSFFFWVIMLAVDLSLFWLARREKKDFWQIADEVTFGLLPFFVLIYAGAFLDGNSVGQPTNMPWGMYFPGNLLRRQPVSLFSAVSFLLIWFLLLRIERRWRVWSWYKSGKDGLVHLVFCGLSGLVSFLVAFWRHSRIYWYRSEIILNLIGVLLLAGLLYWRSGRTLKEDLGLNKIRRGDGQKVKKEKIEEKV